MSAAGPCTAKLTNRERDICDGHRSGAEAERGLLFVGIDVIGDYLTEINVTSPTGLQEINRFDGVRLERRIWDAIEARRAEQRGSAGPQGRATDLPAGPEGRAEGMAGLEAVRGGRGAKPPLSNPWRGCNLHLRQRRKSLYSALI